MTLEFKRGPPILSNYNAFELDPIQDFVHLLNVSLDWIWIEGKELLQGGCIYQL